MKLHIVNYDLIPKKNSKSKINILSIYEQMNPKTAIVTGAFDLLTYSQQKTGRGQIFALSTQRAPPRHAKSSC